MATDSSNPWLAGTVTEAADVAHPKAPPAAVLSGPATPHMGVPTPDVADRLPRRATTATASLWWLGVHGGAGETSLAALLPSSLPAGHAWPQPVGPATDGVRVVLVARSDARGLTAAQRAATEWASGSLQHVTLLGLVISADAPGKLPRPLQDLAALVAGGIPRVWHLPWIEQWRTGDVTAHGPPKPLRRLLEELRALVPAAPAAPDVPTM